MSREIRYTAQIALVIFVIALSLLFSPMKFILTFIVFIGFLSYLITRLDKEERNFVLLWVLIGLLLRVITAILINTFVPSSIDGFFFPDAQSYHQWGERIAALWHQGQFPDLFNEPWLKTFHTAYYRIIAGFYYIFGPVPGVAIAFNCIVSSLTIFSIFYLARTLFTSKEISHAATILASLHPSLWFWSSFLLKDTLHVMLFSWGLLMLVLLIHRYNYWLLACFLIFLYFTFRVRIYGALILALTCIAYLSFFSPKRKIIWITVVVGIIALLGARNIERVDMIYDRLAWSFLNLLPDAYETTLPHILLLFLSGIGRFFFAPFAWIPVRDFDIHLYLYPGQWFLYLLIFPLSLVGFYYCMRENRKDSFFLFFPIVLSVYLFLLVYEGAVPRQRLFLEPLIILLAAFGIQKRPKKSFFIIYYAIFLVLIIVHVVSVRIRYGSFIPL